MYIVVKKIKNLKNENNKDDIIFFQKFCFVTTYNYVR